MLGPLVEKSSMSQGVMGSRWMTRKPSTATTQFQTSGTLKLPWMNQECCMPWSAPEVVCMLWVVAWTMWTVVSTCLPSSITFQKTTSGPPLAQWEQGNLRQAAVYWKGRSTLLGATTGTWTMSQALCRCTTQTQMSGRGICTSQNPLLALPLHQS